MTSEAVKTVKTFAAVITLILAVGGSAYALGRSPDSSDMKELSGRVKDVEIFQATVRANIAAIRESLSRIESGIVK